MHKAVHNAPMGQHKSSRSRAVRMPNERWDAVSAVSEATGKSENQVMNDIVEAAINRLRGNRKTAEIDHNADGPISELFREG